MAKPKDLRSAVQASRQAKPFEFSSNNLELKPYGCYGCDIFCLLEPLFYLPMSISGGRDLVHDGIFCRLRAELLSLSLYFSLAGFHC